VSAPRWPTLLLAAAGLALLLQGAWIPLKATLAQVLLERAWAATTATAGVRPWPWADTRPVGRLRVPRLGIDLIVLAGDSGRTLAFGPGLAAGSVLGGMGTGLVSGHRDTHFHFLPELRPGDLVEVERQDHAVQRYRVRGSQVVDARTTAIAAGVTPRLLLVTCWPLDAAVPGGPLRYVVEAEPEAPTPAS